MLDSLHEPLRQYRIWFYLTIFLVGLSIVTFLLGVIGTLFFKAIQIGVLGTIGGLLANIISLLLFNQLKKAQDDVKKVRAELIEKGNKVINKYYAQLKE